MAKRALLIMAALLGASASGPAGAAEPVDGCFGPDTGRRIESCSELLLRPNLPLEQATMAYAMRALAYSLKGQYDQALPDYDKAIRLNPEFAVALNNRAWALFKAGRAADGQSDIERALTLNPMSPHAIDTRAHIRQSMGETAGAMEDYERAMRLGGEGAVKLYQCGLQSAGLYKGEIDGRYSPDVRRALERCVADRACDPLPADEECRKAAS
jgi:tetratricopeptide (TPR) repeat protein